MTHSGSRLSGHFEEDCVESFRSYRCRNHTHRGTAVADPAGFDSATDARERQAGHDAEGTGVTS